MHTGCGLERPCKRCLQHGLESSCSDLPRKRRLLKKNEENLEIQLVSHPRPSIPLLEDIAGRSPSTEIVPLELPSAVSIEEVIEPESAVQIEEINVDESSLLPDAFETKIWEKPEAEKLWDFNIPDDIVSSWPEMKELKLETVPSNWGNLKSISDQLNLFNQVPPMSEIVDAIPAEVISATTLQKAVPTPQVAQLSQPGLSNVSNIELNFLIQQISELRDANKDLESRLISVTSELLESKSRDSYYSFGLPTGVAFSVWQTASSEEHRLLECNQSFAEISGYPISSLQHGFSFKRLIVGVDPTSLSFFPVKTHMITANGDLKEVTIILNKMPNTNNFSLQIM